jgi:hypothetical protein
LRKKDHFEDLRTRCKNNIKMDIKGTRWEDVDRIDLAQVRNKLRTVVGTVINILLP